MSRFNEYLEAKVNNLFTVGDLINLLNSYDKNLPIGVVGHFGEFHPIDKFDFRTSNVHEKLSYEQKRKDVKAKEFKILAINAPDIGEEPD